MKSFGVLLFVFLIHLSSTAQWIQSPTLPNVNRYDDIVFVDDNEGWTVNSEGQIFHTTDQGNTWTEQINTGKYLRSIEFVDANVGYCGSLESSFYKTTDGGQTWTDIAGAISPSIQGICGISAPDANTVYGCGIWSSPAYIVKSVDGGNTWSYIDMSTYATALVDVEFISPTEGFVVGTANPASDGGIILHTTDGGVTWTTKFQTNVSLDYVWKIQSPDGQNFFASIDAVPVTNDMRLLKSTDGGNTWTMTTVLTNYVYTQMVGFINPMHGWIGAGSILYETLDGGITWNLSFAVSSANRFFKLNETTAFMSGSTVAKYTDASAGLNESIPYNEVHSLEVSPNPTNDEVHIDLQINSTTTAQLLLINSEGKIVNTFLDVNDDPNHYSFDYSLGNYAAQNFYLILKTNEGILHRTIVRK